MRTHFLLATVIMTTAGLAGCFGGGFDFRPGTDFEETGNTVELRIWVEDMVKADVYPGFKANLWAFCAEPFDPNDEYSASAIEYRDPTGVVRRLQSDSTFRVDEEATAKCSVPGPQLRVQQGDRVIVHFANNHFHPHTIHWHGQYVDWESDGAPGVTQDPVVPPPQGSGEFTYDFIAKRAGTLWYHCHVDTQFHVMQGLYGVIIVEPQDEKYEPKDIDKEYSLVLGTLIREQVEYIPPRPGELFDPHAQHKHGLGQCGASGFPNCQNPPVPQPPDVFLINGRSFPDTMHDDQTAIVLKEGDRVRLRIVNTGHTVETIHPHGHDLYVTHRDGNPLAFPFWVDTLTIGPAERYDVVLEADNPGIWMLHTHVNQHETNDDMAPGGMHTMMWYEGFEDQLHTFASELPGGRPPRYAVTIPDDHVDSEFVELPDLNALPVPGVGGGTATYKFSVAEPCALEKIVVHGTAYASNPAFDLLSTIEVTIRDPAGNLLFDGDIGSETLSQNTFRFELNETTPGATVAGASAGDYIVEFSGSNVDAAVALHVLVDYYPSLGAADLAATTYAKEFCGAIPQDVLEQEGYFD